MNTTKIVNRIKNWIAWLFLGSLLLCCAPKGHKNAVDAAPSTANAAASRSATINFDADSARAYIARQVAFGPRVPNAEAHKQCAAYLSSELERHGAKVYRQQAALTAYNGEKLQAVNIIGAFHPDRPRRILLFAHWDSRPYADHDADKANHRKPIDGADDGGSGVGVLLEIARQIGLNPELTPDVGVDIIFFDAEDYGTPEFVDDYKADTWCLGSQFWAAAPHVADYKAEYGILLDMVGARGATFYKERKSVRYAGRQVEKVWSAARDLGYGKYFINAGGGDIIDDHQYVINGRRIPCLDIINYDPHGQTGFGKHWHTLDDNMDNIDKETLAAVGRTVIYVIGN